MNERAIECRSTSSRDSVSSVGFHEIGSWSTANVNSNICYIPCISAPYHPDSKHEQQRCTMSSGEDWDASDYEGGGPATAAAGKTNGTTAAPAPAVKSKYADEDAEDVGEVKVGQYRYSNRLHKL